MTTIHWDVEVARLTAAYPYFKVKHYGDNFIMKFLKGSMLRWVAGTTICYTVYIDDAYFGTDRGANLLKHEGVHVADYDYWGVLFILSYVLLLPVIFSMRAIWEWRGYREDLRAVHAEYKDSKDATYKERIFDYYSQWVANEFCNTDYLFMFPFKTFMYNKCRAFIKSLT